MSTTADLRPHRGRFAPSPTGPLHLGSLVAAMGSYLQSRHHGGEWLLRIEDLDSPREVEGASGWIINSLESHGFEWDQEITWQSERSKLYERALMHLGKTGRLFACRCSRRTLRESGSAGRGTPAYPGTCRHLGLRDQSGMSLRFLTRPGDVCFEDALQGRICEDVARECGDFVVRRKDGLFAYQLAVVVDDASQMIGEVVRGCDLLESTPRQIQLQQALDLPAPAYIHLPLVVARNDEKISKQNGAAGLDDARALGNLIAAHRLLGQEPAKEKDFDSVADFWAWAVPRWDLKPLLGRRKIAAAGAEVN
ncbi:MAG: tRNA glutamyl-Q(34) synthetase GluQRS [Gammaproteobacteria bacterium]|nr:tRNA glutamyl-Q(34) synthetase GluQRS [Gammaproteobacteria bacterium]